MGNLGRPGYTATTDGMWPYSYDHICDAGITANQSSNDGISYLPGMRLPACTCSGQDHPNQGKSRSAPEIDAIEASVGKINPAGDTVGTASQSAQIAPFDLWYNPNYDHMAIFNPEHTSINAYRGGTYQEAISGVTILNNDWYDNNAYQTYGFDYTPGSKGSIRWNVGSMDTWKIEAAALGPNGNIGQRTIPEEPMAMVMNLGMGESFAYVDYNALTPLLPVKMRIDWYSPVCSHRDGMANTPQGTSLARPRLRELLGRMRSSRLPHDELHKGTQECLRQLQSHQLGGSWSRLAKEHTS